MPQVDMGLWFWVGLSVRSGNYGVDAISFRSGSAHTRMRCERIHKASGRSSYIASTLGMISSLSRLRSSRVLETGTSWNGGQRRGMDSPAST
jgi:hypothetical protein